MVPGRAAPNSVPDIGPAAGCTSAIYTHGGGEMINFTLNNSLTFRHTAAHTHWRPCLFCQGGNFVYNCLFFNFSPNHRSIGIPSLINWRPPSMGQTLFSEQSRQWHQSPGTHKQWAQHQLQLRQCSTRCTVQYSVLYVNIFKLYHSSYIVVSGNIMKDLTGVFGRSLLIYLI